ncbi:hypothetical protein HXX76_003709 [Chlamydomonas incerta]|uniref:Pherophorin domain-containing protein n=1 Tax=Chlamydomonas incerta TaxID=51695 RepID=A0A835TN84_CHLIN|nr:hypothetical protein HXX76_003709 [Chlamydomonas incerta]|eukprot:KAG2440855.1 hypothetical protein HXX76_003709 [Chlamydomonas incerta]
MRHTAVALALLALAAAANAQQKLLDFPYSSCTRALTKSKYSVEPNPSHKICWTVHYTNSQCANPSESCCNTDLHKLQLDVKAECKTGFKASATVNGKRTPPPRIYRPPSGSPDQYVLSIPGLGLNGTSANGATICLYLKKGACMDLDSLTPNPVCCATGKYVIAVLFAPYLHDGTIIDGTHSITCNGNKLTACYTTFSEELGAKMAYELEREGPSFLVTAVFGYTGGCPLALAGYSISVFSDNQDCGIFMSGTACAPPTTSFPFFGCKGSAREQGASPFYLKSGIEENTAANEYCVSVYTAVATGNNGRCSKKTTMEKAEFWFKNDMRSQLQSAFLKYDSGAKPTPITGTWGPPGDNNYKLTKLNWTTTYVDTVKPRICLKFKPGTSIQDVSADPDGYVWVALVDADVDCCPTFPAQ